MWTILWWLILLVYVPASLGLIVVVLLQKGKGVGFAGAFGAGGGADTVFGPRSSKSLPQKLTYTMAGLFMFLALVLSLLTDKVNRGIAPEEIDDPSVAAGNAIERARTGDLDELTGEDATATTDASGTEETVTTPAVTVTSAEDANAETATEEAPEAAVPAETPADTPEAAAPTDAPVETPAEVPAEEAAPAEETPAP